MKAPREQTAVALLVENLERAFHRPSWHGPNLRASLRGLTAAQAAWRPAPGRHSIAEQVLHAAYWKYVVRRRLLGEKRGSFPVKGSNWFPLPDRLLEADWQDAIRLLESQHAALRQAVESIADEQLYRPAGGRGKVTYLMLIAGVAAHDLYHAGQINLLKRLQRA